MLITDSLTPSWSEAEMFSILEPGARSSHIVVLKGPGVENCGTDGFFSTVKVKVAVAVFPGDPLSYAVTISCKLRSPQHYNFCIC